MKARTPKWYLGLAKDGSGERIPGIYTVRASSVAHARRLIGTAAASNHGLSILRVEVTCQRLIGKDAKRAEHQASLMGVKVLAYMIDE